MDNNYWFLTLFDGSVIEIPPEAVSVVKKRLADKDPINLKSRTIPASQVVDFQLSAKQKDKTKLLEDVSRAFGEPMYENDDVVFKWVKKQLSSKEYSKEYQGLPAYRLLGEFNGLKTVAFKLPVHLIDPDRVEECTQDEINKLTS